MLKTIEYIAFSPYTLLAVMIMLCVAVILLLLKRRSAQQTILDQAKCIEALNGQILALETQVKALQRHCEPVVQPSVKSEIESQNEQSELVATQSPVEDDAVAEDELLAEEDDSVVEDARAEKLSGSDEDLLNRFVAHIEGNMKDINLSIDDIASDLCMSRSNLFRKIKQITGMGPNEYIRLARLKRAAQLLREGRHSIADICMLVGFNSPSYFSSCFKKHYGCLPKDYK